MEARSFEPVPVDPTTLESQFYPGMPAGTMIYIAHAGCHGTCPVYSVAVTGKGLVTYTGFRNVGTTGRHVYAVGQELAANLAERMVSTGFYTFSDQYPYQVDASMIITGLHTGRAEPKLIIDYGVKVPPALVSLRQEIEMTLGIDRLIRIQPGAAETPFSVSGEY